MKISLKMSLKMKSIHVLAVLYSRIGSVKKDHASFYNHASLDDATSILALFQRVCVHLCVPFFPGSVVLSMTVFLSLCVFPLCKFCPHLEASRSSYCNTIA